MKSLAILTFSLAAVASAPAFANQELAQKKNCMACHSIDKKVVGPAYKDVAAKYAGQKDAADKLAQKIMKGGSGVWGPVPMPANTQVNEAEAKQLAAWVLSLKCRGQPRRPCPDLASRPRSAGPFFMRARQAVHRSIRAGC